MKTKNLFASLFAILFLFSVANAVVTYPNPVDHVNDFAKILSADTAKKLETELRTYKDQTGIEIAVVTVLSLEGLPVEEYTIGLAKKWGVGSKKKDDSVVLLVAPNERKVRIEVGYGLEPDLTDSKAGRVIRDQIIPLFKEGRMADGVVAGVAGILTQLGDTPYKAREEERAAATERKRAEDERSAEALKNFLFIAGIILLSALALWGLVHAVNKVLARRAKLQRLHAENAKLLATCKEKIDEAESEYEPSLMLLDILKKENPKELWQELEEKVGKIPEAVKSLKVRYEEALTIYMRGYKYSEESRSVISKLHGDTAEYSSVYELVLAKESEIKVAKKKSHELLENLQEAIKRASEETNHPDVQNEAREVLKDAERKYAAASAMLQVPAAQMINWLSVYAFLSSASSLASGTMVMAKHNKAEADTARREGPKLLKEMPDSIEKTAKKVAVASASVKSLVESARAKFKEAQNLAEKTSVNWLIVFALLVAVSSLLKKAVDKAKAEEEEAEERRKRRRRSDDSYHSSSSSSSWSSGSSGGGGGFGGFGGGGFGGGGASGSW